MELHSVMAEYRHREKENAYKSAFVCCKETTENVSSENKEN